MKETLLTSTHIGQVGSVREFARIWELVVQAIGVKTVFLRLHDSFDRHAVFWHFPF